MEAMLGTGEGRQAANDEGTPRRRVTLLRTQRRMHATIAGWASANFYGGRLDTAGGAAARLLCDPNPHPAV